ncbi:MAG: alpha/beta hydrolase [Gemmatimonadota bacterium]|nr:MAG: alpha/beta hydrolase [Gemmatimonadota bacterium]
MHLLRPNVSAVVVLLFAACAVERQFPPQGYIDIDDSVRLHYRTIGDGPDTVVVPAGMYLTEDLSPLATHRTLIFYDMRGRGRSSRVIDGSKLGLDHDIDDLEAVRRHFGISRMSLVGFSYLGAMVALYAAEHPEHVNRVVQMGAMPPRSSAPYMERTPPTALIDTAKVNHLREMESSGALASNPMGYCEAYWDTYLVMYVGIAASADSITLPCNLRNEWPQNFSVTLQHVMSKLPEWDWRVQVRTVAAPTLTLHGDADRIAPPEGGREWAAILPDARLLIFPNVGHLIWAESRTAFLDAVDQFLDGQWPRGSRVVEAGSQASR